MNSKENFYRPRKILPQINLKTLEEVEKNLDKELSTEKNCKNIKINNENVKDNNKMCDSSTNNNDDENDDIITRIIGNYGLWQFTWTFILSLFQIASSFHMFAIVFQTSEKDFWCARPSHLKNVDKNLWINLTQPQGSCLIKLFDMDSINENNIQRILANASSTETLIHCEKFEYANDDYWIGDTLIQEWNLVCDREYLASVLEMCFLAGVAVGSLTSGWISDNYGRKHVLMGFITVQASIGILLAFIKNLTVFMCLRFIMGFASMTVTGVSFVLVVELVGNKYQTMIGILNMLPVAFTYFIISGIAYLTQDWRLLQFVISIPWIFFLLIWYCVPESPRWLLEEGKIEKLKIILQKACRMNRLQLPDNYEKVLTHATSSIGGEGENTISDPLLMVFRKEYRMTTTLTLIQWFSLVIVYFGLGLHIGKIGGNLYINTALSGVIEAVGILISLYTVYKFGLRKNLIVLSVISAIACLILNFIPEHYAIIKVGLGVAVKSAAGIANFLNPIFTALQYPTVIRNFGIGIGNFGSGIALILVPYMWILGNIEVYIPFVIMGMNGLLAALAFFLVRSDDAGKKPKTVVLT